MPRLPSTVQTWKLLTSAKRLCKMLWVVDVAGRFTEGVGSVGAVASAHLADVVGESAGSMSVFVPGNHMVPMWSLVMLFGEIWVTGGMMDLNIIGTPSILGITTRQKSMVTLNLGPTTPIGRGHTHLLVLGRGPAATVVGHSHMYLSMHVLSLHPEIRLSIALISMGPEARLYIEVEARHISGTRDIRVSPTNGF